MNRHLLIAGLCCLSLAACSKGDQGTIGLGGPCLYTADCASPFVCYDGACQLGPSVVCETDTRRCSGGSVEVCSTHGDRWDTVEACSAGCLDGACVARACTPGERKCDGTFIAECLPSGEGFVSLQACPTACSDSGGVVQCSSPICTPFETRCRGTDTNVLETCNARGTAWLPSQCSETDGAAVCVAGRCQATVCSVSSTEAGVTRQQRCNGPIAEECNDTGTGWVSREVCDGGCDIVEGRAECANVICEPFQTRCKADRETLQTCNARGTAFNDTLCTFGADQGRCVQLPGGAGACYPKACSVTRDAGGVIIQRDERCTTSAREQCNDTETGWEAVEMCAYGCNVDADQCAAPACAVGEEACDGLVLTRCTPDQKGFGFVQHCASGCEVNTTTTPITASCKAPVCPPLSRVCATDDEGKQFVEVCRADGSASDRLEECLQGCVAGVCVTPASTCVPGQVRCKGVEVEECVRDNTTGDTRWQFVETCLGQCSAGACSDDGACGCSDGDVSVACGSATRPPVTLTTVLPAGTQAPCDNASTVLLFSNEITSATGELVPDGTLVTFATDSALAPLASSDVAPELPGLQRPTLHGRATVVVKAPNACAEPLQAVVRASVAGRCSGEGQVGFVPLDTLPTVGFVADDFSTIRTQDPAATTALWDTHRGTLEALSAVNLGSGGDGDFVATPAQGETTVDLQAKGYMPAWNVQTMGTQDVTIDGVQANLSPGEEVLLYTVWGDGYNGTYEFKHVASVSTGRVTFTQPIQRRFSGGDLGAVPPGYRVVLQRVPHFQNVTVPEGITLTASAMTSSMGIPTGGSGIMAFRARGTVNVLGSISMVNKGLPTGVSNTKDTTAPSMPKLMAGNPSASAGSGAIYIHAGEVTFGSEAGAIVTANGNGGRGGSVWVAANNIVVGINAERITTTAQVRLDYAAIDDASIASSPAAGDPDFFVGQEGSFFAQTRPDAQATLDNIKAVRLLGVLGGNGATGLVTANPEQNGLTELFPQLGLEVSADGNVSRESIDLESPATFSGASRGNQFWWRAALTNTDERSVFVRGLVFQLDLEE